MQAPEQLLIIVCKVCDVCIVACNFADATKLTRVHLQQAHSDVTVFERAVFERRYVLKAILCGTCDVTAFVEEAQWQTDHAVPFNHPNYSVTYAYPPESLAGESGDHE